VISQLAPAPVAGVRKPPAQGKTPDTGPGVNVDMVCTYTQSFYAMTDSASFCQNYLTYALRLNSFQ
jgi:hypothetical protein